MGAPYRMKKRYGALGMQVCKINRHAHANAHNSGNIENGTCGTRYRLHISPLHVKMRSARIVLHKSLEASIPTVSKRSSGMYTPEGGNQTDAHLHARARGQDGSTQ